MCKQPPSFITGSLHLGHGLEACATRCSSSKRRPLRCGGCRIAAHCSHDNGSCPPCALFVAIVCACKQQRKRDNRLGCVGKAQYLSTAEDESRTHLQSAQKASEQAGQVTAPRRYGRMWRSIASNRRRTRCCHPTYLASENQRSRRVGRTLKHRTRQPEHEKISPTTGDGALQSFCRLHSLGGLEDTATFRARARE